MNTNVYCSNTFGLLLYIEIKLKWFEDSFAEMRKKLTLHSQNFLSYTEMEGHWNTWSTRTKMTRC